MTTSECFIAIYGTLRRHPWIHLDDLREDPWSLFRTYTELLTPSRVEKDSTTGLLGLGRAEPWWDVSEAGGNWGDDAEYRPSHILWVQTALSTITQGLGLPIAELGLCAEKVLQRIGTASISGVQMIIPAGYSFARQPQASGILRTANPAARKSVQIEIHGGRRSTFSQNATQIVEELNSRCMNDNIRFDPAVIELDSVNLIDEPGEMDRAVWLSSNIERMSTRVSVPEFSLDVCGYLIAHIVLSCQLSGVDSPTLITLRIEDSV